MRLLVLFPLVLPFALAQDATPAQAAVPAQDAAPGADEQDRMLERIEAYGAHYVSSLPDFLCVQVTRHFEAALNSNRFHKGDTITEKLSFHDGEEKRTVDLVNGKPADGARRPWRERFTSEGEFGILIDRVLGPDSYATFTWSRWETVRGKRLAVFDYAVDKERSTLHLELSDLARAVLAYHGSVFADPATGAVWRITEAVTKDIPPQLQTREVSTVIDYDQTTIGDRQYLLPVTATVSAITWQGRIRNEMEFREYRKFGADSVIHFEGGDQK
jgi:hypothetical protein